MKKNKLVSSLLLATVAMTLVGCGRSNDTSDKGFHDDSSASSKQVSSHKDTKSKKDESRHQDSSTASTTVSQGATSSSSSSNEGSSISESWSKIKAGNDADYKAAMANVYSQDKAHKSSDVNAAAIFATHDYIQAGGPMLTGNYQAALADQLSQYFTYSAAKYGVSHIDSQVLAHFKNN